MRPGGVRNLPPVGFGFLPDPALTHGTSSLHGLNGLNGLQEGDHGHASMALKLIVDEQVAPQVGDHAHLLIAIDQSGADTHVNAGRSSHIPGCQHIVPYFMCEQRQNKFLRTGGSGSSSTHERCCAPQVHMNAHGAQIDPGQGVLRRFLQERGPVEASDGAPDELRPWPHGLSHGGQRLVPRTGGSHGRPRTARWSSMPSEGGQISTK